MQSTYVVCINLQCNLNHNQQNTSRWYGNKARRQDNDHKYCCNFFRNFRLYNLSNLKRISSIEWWTCHKNIGARTSVLSKVNFCLLTCFTVVVNVTSLTALWTWTVGMVTNILVETVPTCVVAFLPISSITAFY